MSLNRYAARRDIAEGPIVDALERIGAQVWRLKEPCDLLVKYRGRWQPLEVKTPKARKDKRQVKQNDFLAMSGCPIVKTPEQALAAILNCPRNSAKT